MTIVVDDERIDIIRNIRIFILKIEIFDILKILYHWSICFFVCCFVRNSTLLLKLSDYLCHSSDDSDDNDDLNNRIKINHVVIIFRKFWIDKMKINDFFNICLVDSTNIKKIWIDFCSRIIDTSIVFVVHRFIVFLSKSVCSRSEEFFCFCWRFWNNKSSLFTRCKIDKQKTASD